MADLTVDEFGMNFHPIYYLGDGIHVYSAHHRFANLHGYMGVGQAGTGMGLLQGTHLKLVPMQWVWWVFSSSIYTLPVLYFP